MHTGKGTTCDKSGSGYACSKLSRIMPPGCASGDNGFAAFTSGYAADLSCDEKIVLKAVRDAALMERPFPTIAQLAVALGQGNTANIPALLDSIKAKGRVNNINFFALPGQQQVLDFGTARKRKMRFNSPRPHMGGQ